MRSSAITLFVTYTALNYEKINEDIDTTITTITPIHGSTSISDTTTAMIARIANDASVHTSEHRLNRLALDLKPQALLDHSTHIEVTDASSFTLKTRHAFIETQTSKQIQVSTTQNSLQASDTSFSARTGKDKTIVYIVHSKVNWTHRQERSLAGTGEQLKLNDGDVEHNAATL